MMKKKVSVVAVLAMLLAIALIGGSLAYFTDTDSSINTFTVGDVDITLTEAEEFEDFKLIPTMVVDKNPTITNVGSEDAYIAAKIIVSDGAGDISKIIGMEGTNLIRIQEVVKGGYVKETDTLKPYNGISPVFGDSSYSVYQVAENDSYVFYIFAEGAQAKDATVVLFEQLVVPAEWDHAELKEFAELRIEVEAYAVQAAGFESCYQAMTTAFADKFNFS